MLMKGPLVLATLNGTKTQTRRLDGLQMIDEHPDDAEFVRFQDGYKDGRVRAVFDVRGEIVGIPCPYGYVGDRIWIRETWAHPNDLRTIDVGLDALLGVPFYRADEPSGLYHDDGTALKWRPSIHMPRWASRITLENTDLRLERLQDISEADAIAEGVDAISVAAVPRQSTISRRQDFFQLWRKIYKKPGTRVVDDPWVWAYTFRRIDA